MIFKLGDAVRGNRGMSNIENVDRRGVVESIDAAPEKLALRVRWSNGDLSGWITSLKFTPISDPKLTGGSSGYYKVDVNHPTSAGVQPYTAECNDIIEALGLNFAEGNAFKAIWRIGADRMGKGKAGTTALYDSEKVEFFGKRMVVQNKESK